jgi:hypothetical protein
LWMRSTTTLDSQKQVYSELGHPLHNGLISD